MLVNVPRLDALLEQHATALGDDLLAYRNHTYRVINFFCLLSGGEPPELDKVAIAAAYHDIGIWTARTFDYLPPSMILAAEYLKDINKMEWLAEIDAMIGNHHKITPFRSSPSSAETFRRADWIDVSMGRLRFGLTRCAVTQVMRAFPGSGFHRLLFKLTVSRLIRHPLKPLPMFRW